MKTIKFGILGCGHIATKMAEAVKCLESSNKGIEAYAVASRDLAKAKTFANNNGFKKFYGSYKQLASDKEIDLIYIATPHSEHFEHAKLCIESHKNILIEKAFCANLKQTSIIINLAKEKNVFLCEAMWTRFLPAIKTLKNWIESEKIGFIESVEADFSQPISHINRLQNPSLAGGALLDLGIYSLTFADLFLGTKFEYSSNNSNIKTNPKKTNDIIKIEGKCIPFHTGVDATDWIKITYENNKTAHLKTSMIDNPHNEGKIFGTKGFIRIQNINDFEKIELYNDSGNLIEEVFPEKLANRYEYEILSCIKALRNGKKECNEMPLSKTLEMMQIMDNLRNSWGVHYPFEIHPNIIWDRTNDKSILQIYNIKTHQAKILCEFDYVIEAPNWSYDGAYLTYNSEGRIYKMELKNNSEEISVGKISIVPSYYIDNCNNDHVLSPDKSGLYVSHHTKEDKLSRIYKIYFDGRKPKLITPLGPSYLHGISPDGKTLVYCAERNGEYDIYSISSEGGIETRLTNAKGLNDGPEFDSKGNYIWFNSVRSGRMQAYRMKSDGTEQTQITDDLHWNTWFPHISPDSKHAVMVCYNENDVRPDEHVPNKHVELRMIDIDTTKLDSFKNWSNARTILKIFGGQGTINVNSWSPDSKYFAFVSYQKKN